MGYQLCSGKTRGLITNLFVYCTLSCMSSVQTNGYLFIIFYQRTLNYNSQDGYLLFFFNSSLDLVNNVYNYPFTILRM